MKFGKEFMAQMVPEWQQAYMDYNFLKTLLKEIQRFKQRNRPPITPGGLKRKTTLYRAFSGLIQKHNPMSPSYASDIENQDIVVNSVSRDGDPSYETTFLMSSDEGGEYELVYFRRLDDEFNKVDKFYISKVQETIKEAAILNKQMDALIAFRIKVENPQGAWFDRSVEMTRLASDIAASTAELSISTPAGARTSRRDRHMDVIEEIEESSHRHSDESSGDNKESNNIKQTEFVSISHDQLPNRSTSVVHNRRAKTPSPKPASDIAASAVELPISTPTGARTSRRAHLMDVTEEIGESSHGQSDELSDDNKESIKIKQNVQATKQPVSIKTNDRPASLEILNRVKINHTLDTPRSTIKGVLGVPQPTQLKFSRKNLRKVEDQLKRAFVEFHQKLRLLKSYCFLNTLAFSKIMKKYDKITSRNAAKSYMKMVDNSYLGSSDEVSKLLERVEATFIKHFSNSNRSKGMNILRPTAKRERHRTSFSTGFLAGCTTALVIALISTIRAHKILAKPGKKQYMDNMFPLYSLFALLVLHMLVYAANIYYWRKYRVNYSFIFGFKQGTELGYRQVLLVSFAISVLALLTVFSNLDMEIDPITKNYNAFTEALPLILLVVLFALLLLPFNILYRSSRFFFLVCLFHCIAAPLYKVTLPDFFLADQFTSQVQALRILEFYICYYVWGDFELRNNACKSSTVYKSFLFIVAAIPYMSRLLQCLRRLFEEKDPMQGYNGLKYFLTIVAVCMRTALVMNHRKHPGWKITSWFFSISAAIFATYWDLVIDWGLLNRHSKNRWLRDKLLVPQKSVYFIAMGLNVLLRFAWLQTVLGLNVGFLHINATITIVAGLEIIRRGIWNFFRLENEHLTNVGKYRAFKTVPLPFNYDEDGDKDE